jgi:hypothetical protein
MRLCTNALTVLVLTVKTEPPRSRSSIQVLRTLVLTDKTEHLLNTKLVM